MNEYNNPNLTENSQKLRREMTKEEKHLWYDFLKGLPINVYRQKVFGNYIADFYIAKAKLTIELDGSQHFSEEGNLSDRLRDAYFANKGITVLRYTNLEINQDFRSVCEDILQHIDTAIKPSP